MCELYLTPKSIDYKFNINTQVELQLTSQVIKTLSKSYIVKKQASQQCSLHIKYSNPNVNKIIDIIKETIEHIDGKKIKKLEINTSDHNDLLEKLIQLDCFDTIELKKRYLGMCSFKEMKNVLLIKYSNHFYSNLKLLPDTLQILNIDVKKNSNVFLELPKNLKCIEYSAPNGQTEHIELEYLNMNTILFVNSNEQIPISNLTKAEYIILNVNNKFIDWYNLPTSIKAINWSKSFGKLETKHVDWLPDSIEELIVKCDYDINMFSNLPSSVKKIKVEFCNIDILKILEILPNNIECVELDFNAIILMFIDFEFTYKINNFPNKLKQVTIITPNGQNDIATKTLNILNEQANKHNFNLTLKKNMID